jgi:glycerate kinase
MKVLIATDKWKGSLSALRVGEILKEELQNKLVTAHIKNVALADGGEGTLDFINGYKSGTFYTKTVSGPRMRPVEAMFFMAGSVAYIQMSEAAGMVKLGSNEKNNALETSTFGVGELIKEAIEKEAEKIVITLGGSATSDLGVGMAAALGWRFLDKEGKEIKPIGANLKDIQGIEKPANPSYNNVSFEVWCDVANPLNGPEGAIRVYGPQKGVDENGLKDLEIGFEKIQNILKDKYNLEIEEIKGAGAAGGLGAGCILFLNAKPEMALDKMIEESGFEKKIDAFDLILTGEGSYDFQSKYGKVPFGIKTLANKHKIPVIIVAGQIASSAKTSTEKYFAACDYAPSIEESIKKPEKYLRALTTDLARAITESF